MSHPPPGTTASLARLAVHTITTKPWSLEQAASEFGRRGMGGMSVWVEALRDMPVSQARAIIDDAGLQVPALVRGGFFCDPVAAARQARVDHNRELIQTAAGLGAEMLVLVVGSTPGVELGRQRGWVSDAIQALIPEAAAAGVRLAIEPLHPMYAADRSCVNRLTEARVICEQLGHPIVGVAVDVYHVWWDPQLREEIASIGAGGRLFAYHLCDWRVPTRDMLNDRALMGDGCIDLRSITRWVRDTGFDGWDEVEIFSEEHWREDQSEFLDRIIDRYGRLDTAIRG